MSTQELMAAIPVYTSTLSYYSAHSGVHSAAMQASPPGLWHRGSGLHPEALSLSCGFAPRSRVGVGSEPFCVLRCSRKEVGVGSFWRRDNGWGLGPRPASSNSEAADFVHWASPRGEEPTASKRLIELENKIN